jgi:ribosomal protein S18 acetylase RimI-like enzyme
MKIVRATLTELDRAAALFDLYRIFYEQPSDLALARKFLKERLENGESVIYLAENEAGDSVGFMQLFASFSSVSACRMWILNDLYVSETLRGGGIGTALLQRAADHARETGARRVVLSTAHTNTRAQRVYESFGYVMDTKFRQYAYEVA